MRHGIGLDGCAGGWVCVHAQPGSCRATLLPGIEMLDALLDGIPARERRVLVDIPIGLTVAGDRRVDVEARRLLGRQGSSVFGIPPRPVFDARSYPEALALADAAWGKGLSKQAFHILPKIREVDLWLRRRGAAPLRESHPELAFRGLARLAGIDAGRLASKKTEAGAATRREILAAHGIDPGALCAELEGARIARDDVLDAAALAATARLTPSQLATVPARAETDALGLPMEMIVPAAVLNDESAA